MTNVLVPALSVSPPPWLGFWWGLGKGTVRQNPPPLPVSASHRWGLLLRSLPQSPPLFSIRMPPSVSPPSFSSSRDPVPRLSMIVPYEVVPYYIVP